MGRAAAGGFPPAARLFLVISNIFFSGRADPTTCPAGTVLGRSCRILLPHLGAVGEEEYRRVGTAPGGN